MSLLFDLTVYLVVFVSAAIGIPAFVSLAGPSMPGFLRSIFGPVNWVLGMLTFDIGILVQREQGGYEMCPGRRPDDSPNDLEVYVDEEWHTIEGGHENLSRHGMRPFGLLYFKEDAAFGEYREDAKAVVTGSEESRRKPRGGFEHSQKPATSGDESYLINTTKVVEGMQQVARSSIINRAEEQQLKKEAKSSGYSSIATILGAFGGLLVGVITGGLVTGMI